MFAYIFSLEKCGSRKQDRLPLLNQLAAYSIDQALQSHVQSPEIKTHINSVIRQADLIDVENHATWLQRGDFDTLGLMTLYLLYHRLPQSLNRRLLCCNSTVWFGLSKCFKHATSFVRQGTWWCTIQAAFRAYIIYQGIRGFRFSWVREGTEAISALTRHGLDWSQECYWFLLLTTRYT